MLIIWAAKTSVTSTYISEKLKDKKDWKITSILTFLSRLVEKGFIISKREKKINVYTAIIDEHDYLESESKTLLEKLYGNSLTSFVNSLYKSKTITQNDLVELQQFIEKTPKDK
jgi:predicted transcriptional regulator